MSRIDDRVRTLIAAASRVALRDPDAALRMFAEAATLGELTGCEGIAYAFEAMGRVAIACGDLETARDALTLAEQEALAIDDDLLAARSRATRSSIDRLRPYASSADAFAAEIRHASDLLEAARFAATSVAALHAAQARMELRRRLAGPRGLPAIGKLEIALALSALEVAVLSATAALTLEPDLERILPVGTWPEVFSTWLGTGVEIDVELELVFARLVTAGLVELDEGGDGGDGRPRLASEVESLLVGRGQPVLPDGFRRASAPPIWREAPPGIPRGPATPPRLLVVTGSVSTATDHIVHLAWAHGWPLWLTEIAGDASPISVLRDLRAVVRETLVHDKLLGIVVHALEAETIRLVIVAATALLDRVVVIAPTALVLPTELSTTAIAIVTDEVAA